MSLKYQLVKDGFEIVGGEKIFNRPLYGGHDQDELPERYFTFAGDQPLIMGAITDWRAREDCTMAKCGVFMAGLALTPGVQIPIFCYSGEKDGDRTSFWFHESSDIVSTFRNGWMEYELQIASQCFPRAQAFLEVLPLQTHAGFLVHLRVSSERSVHLALGFGAITDFLGRLEFPIVPARNFLPEHCRGNRITTGANRVLVEGDSHLSLHTSMRIGTSFPVEVSIGNAGNVKQGPGKFLARDADPKDAPIARMTCSVEAGKPLDGFVVVLRNTDEATLDQWLSQSNPAETLKQQIRRKHSAVEINTPDAMLDVTMPPNVIAMDSCWHEKAFCHGAVGWHCPYMGWRNWYGPTVLGWHDRVGTAFRTHAATQVQKEDIPEKVVYTGPGQYYQLHNSYGFIPEIPDGRKTIFYNMQEVGVDMFLHHLEWSDELKSAGEWFDVISGVLDWEERILDPDGDGLYQNWLNTWISDAHSYNGGGCAQASVYNLRANRMMGIIARHLKRDPSIFEQRAKKIQEALQTILWRPEKGVLAEYVDTLDRRIVHDSPELATAYHAIECKSVDHFQAYQLLRFTETDIRNEKTIGRGGRLAWSSNWYPQNYSSCGLYIAENLHLAWAYFHEGLSEKGWEILNAVVDAHFLGITPGAVYHCATGSGSTLGSLDFTDVPSLYLRVVVEGVFGIRFHLLENYIEIAPCFPVAWDHCSLRFGDGNIEYRYTDNTETIVFFSETKGNRIFKIPLRSVSLSARLNGKDTSYTVESGIGRSYAVIQIEESGRIELEVKHKKGAIPKLEISENVSAGAHLQLHVTDGRIQEVFDPSHCLENITVNDGMISARAIGTKGWHTVFIRVKKDLWDSWMPADFQILDIQTNSVKILPNLSENFEPVNIESYFNCSLMEIHKQEYRSPRPEGYSIGMRLNGRYGWDWNHGGFNTVLVDDQLFRKCRGVFQTPSDIPFATPASGPNVACVSLWDNFPEEISFPLSGYGVELDVFLIGVTNPMQSRIKNASLTLEYKDKTTKTIFLIPPVNFDDWLNAAYQTENETVHFNDYNHGMIVKMPLDPMRHLAHLIVSASAYEVIVGILGITVCRPIISGKE